MRRWGEGDEGWVEKDMTRESVVKTGRKMEKEKSSWRKREEEKWS